MLSCQCEPTPQKIIIIKEEERTKLVDLGSSLSTLTGKVNNVTNWDYSPETQNNQEKLSGYCSLARTVMLTFPIGTRVRKSYAAID